MIDYSEHARIRMRLRHITETQVEEVLRTGTREPSLKGRQVVRARIEGFQLILVVIEEDDRTTVITTYRNPPWEG